MLPVFGSVQDSKYQKYCYYFKWKNESHFLWFLSFFLKHMFVKQISKGLLFEIRSKLTLDYFNVQILILMFLKCVICNCYLVLQNDHRKLFILLSLIRSDQINMEGSGLCNLIEICEFFCQFHPSMLKMSNQKQKQVMYYVFQVLYSWSFFKWQAITFEKNILKIRILYVHIYIYILQKKIIFRFLSVYI